MSWSSCSRPTENYTVSFAGAGYTSEMIPVLSGEELGSDQPAVYDGVVIDGIYGDWDAYPHSLIEYATPGTQVSEPDAEGALYYADRRVFGHVSTAMPEHLSFQSGDFLAAISIAFNGDRSYKDTPDKGNFYPRVIDIDENGTVSVLNEGTRLENGEWSLSSIWTGRPNISARTRMT